MRQSITAWLALGGGLALLTAAQLARPGLVPPLYDGVVVVEPYRWVVPPSGAPGDPGSFSQSETVESGVSPAFAATTAERPPQAQLLVPPAAFVVPDGATAIQVEISPTAPVAVPSIAGNAYGFSVIGPDGRAVPIRLGSLVTIVLRAPAGTGEARIVRLDGAGAVEAVTTEGGGQVDTYLATVDALGTFAIAGTSGDGRSGPVLVTLAMLAAVGFGGLVLLWLRERRGHRHPAGRESRSR